MHAHLETHVWEATDPPTPAPMLSILSLPRAAAVPSKSLVCPRACSERSQHLYGRVSVRPNYFVLSSTDKRLFSSFPQEKRELRAELN